MAARWTRIETMEPNPASGPDPARARERGTRRSLARADLSPRTRFACDFALLTSDAGARERDAAAGATALISPWGP